eukprot:s94_g76.t1
MVVLEKVWHDDVIWTGQIDALDEQTTFANAQQRRLQAGIAFFKLIQMPSCVVRWLRSSMRAWIKVVIGQRCWHWRIQGTGNLQKAKWKGPARCVASEFSQDGGKVVVHWLVHGTSLLRCSPAHVRPMVEEIGSNVPINPEAALKDLEEIRARSTTQFRDMAKESKPVEPILEDLYDEPDHDPPAAVSDDEGYAPTEMAPEEAGMELPTEVSGIVQILLPGLREREERERSPRRRRESDASTELPGPLEHPLAPALPGDHPPPERPPDGSPSKRARTDLEVAAATPVPEEPERDELAVDDVRCVDLAKGTLPAGWRVVDNAFELDEAWLATATGVNHLRPGEINVRELNVSEREKVIQAKMKELESFFANKGTPDANGQIGPLRAKARLVLRGYQDPDLMTLEKNSPTSQRTGKMILLVVATIHGWHLWCGDVQTAFLSGAGFDREILVLLPKDCAGLLGCDPALPVHMRMLKSAYGLADAPLLWFREASRRLVRLGWKAQELGKCTFAYYNKAGELEGLLILHVDDMLIAGRSDPSEFQDMLVKLKQDFSFGKWEELSNGKKIAYCGGDLRQEGSKVLMGYEYLKKVCPISIAKGRDAKEKLSRGLLGALQWPGGQRMPALCATTSLLAGELALGNGEVMQQLNKCLRFAKEASKHPMVFDKIVEKVSDLAIVCFCNAAFGVRQDLSSQGGYLIVLTDKRVLRGEKCKFCTVAWRSFKLLRVCRSSLSAESQSMASALEGTLLVKLFLKMLLGHKLTIDEAQKNLNMDTAVVTDCTALYDLLQRDGVQFSLDKRVATEGLVIKDLLRQLHAQLRWVSSERQVSDGMTKLATRQHMVDVLKSGYIQLIADENFQAAKKKSAADRETSRLATASRIAAATVALVPAENLKGSAEAGTSSFNFTLDLGFIMTVLTMIAFPMMIGLWHWWTTSSTSSTALAAADDDAASPTEERVVDIGVQTTLSGYEMQALYEQFVEADIRLDSYKQEISDLLGMVKQYEEVELEHCKEIDLLSQKEFELRRLASASLFHTKHSTQYHGKRDCKYLHREIIHLSACTDCTACTFPPMSSSRREPVDPTD